jgi:hypothetical protein
MIETKSMKNIRVIKVETKRMMNISAKRMIIYRIASIIEIIDTILKNEIEMIVSMSISFLIMKIDDCKDFLMNEIDHCKNFLIFQKFLELLIEMKMRVIVSKNFSLLTIREMISWVIDAFLEWRIFLALNVLEMIIFMILNVLILNEMMTFVMNNSLSRDQNSFAKND